MHLHGVRLDQGSFHSTDNASFPKLISLELLCQEKYRHFVSDQWIWWGVKWSVH